MIHLTIWLAVDWFTRERGDEVKIPCHVKHENVPTREWIKYLTQTETETETSRKEERETISLIRTNKSHKDKISLSNNNKKVHNTLHRFHNPARSTVHTHKRNLYLFVSLSFLKCEEKKMAKSNEESSNLNVMNKPPLKKTKTLPSLNLRVSVTPPNPNDNNGIGGTSTTKTDFSEQQWNYPSFLGIGSTSRKRRQPPPPPSKPPVNLIPPHPRPLSVDDHNKTTSSLLPQPSSSSITKQQQQHSISSPIFYLVSLLLLHFFSFHSINL